MGGRLAAYPCFDMARKKDVDKIEFKRTRKLPDGTVAPHDVDVLLYILGSLKKIEALLEEQIELQKDDMSDDLEY